MSSGAFDMNLSIPDQIQQLKNAVETIMSPCVTQEVRMQAQQLCEEFRENSPFIIDCGFLLAEKQEQPFVRHFGLQLLEHTVKYRWNNLTGENKILIKDTTMQYCLKGTHGILEEELYIKDAISRIVVEMAKREWPQHWPTFLDELEEIARTGDVQTELVLMVWLRLVEDTVAFQTIQTQRRRDIQQTIVAHMSRLISFFMTCLQTNVTKFKMLGGGAKLAQVYCRLSRSTLATLCGFVDWISVDYVTENNNMLLQMLCTLLSDTELQFNAAECLLLIVNRKGKVEERKPLLVLFCEDAMQSILNATELAASAELDEYHYQFMKKLTQVLTGIGSQLSVLWGSDAGVSRPENFDKYLGAILALAAHPSQMLGSYTQVLLASFLKHEHIKEDPDLLKKLPAILNVVIGSLIKVGCPTLNNHASCAYSQIDFDCEEEFLFFFSKFRAELSDTVRCATLLNPAVAFEMMSINLSTMLQKPIIVDGVKGNLCTLTSPAFLEWDALTIFMECVMSRLNKEDSMFVPKGLELLQQCLYYTTQDPLILSCVLSYISALFPFLNFMRELLPAVLEKLFAAVVFSPPGQTKSTRSRSVKNVRRHACSILVRVCKDYPALLLPTFDNLHHHIKQLCSDPEQLSSMEQCTLMESLVLISNQFCQFDKQSAFVEEMLIPVRKLWLSTEFNIAFRSACDLMSFVGLDHAPVEPSSADSCGINRSHILYCINTILAMMKRSKPPDDPEVAKSGGFVLDIPRSNGQVVLCNPATPHIQPLLENLLLLAKSFNSFWLPENLAKRHPEFSKAYELPDTEKKSVIGVPVVVMEDADSHNAKNPLERMQNFIVKTPDSLYRILGDAGMCLGYQFYTVPNLTTMVLNTVFSCIEVLPDFQLRNIIRVFVKPHIQRCPQELYETAVLPILARLCPYMHQKLTDKWHVINQRCDAGVQLEEESDPESQEILEDQLTRRLTRDYIDTLGIIINLKADDPASSTEEGMMESELVAPQQTVDEESTKVLLNLMMKDNSICTPVVLTVFNSLSWNDSTTCNRSIGLCWPIFKQLMKQQYLSGNDACHLLSAVFMGLQLHGQHEGTQPGLVSLAMQMYDSLIFVFPDVDNIMKQIPSYDEKNMKQYHDAILLPTTSRIPDKKHKEMFRRLITGIIGKNVGQQFKREVNIKNLPKMFTTRPKNPSIDEQTTESLGICGLFKPDGD